MITIRTIRYDDIDDFQIEMPFEDLSCSSSLEIWGQSEMFDDFAKSLINFPFDQKKPIVFEWGEDDKKWAYYLLIMVELYDPSGKILIKTLVDSKGDEATHYRCAFPIITDVVTINELGKQLLNWKPAEKGICIFPCEDLNISPSN
jgi:hypothetical protein